MFCPQCGTESASDLPYCRACGANLKVIGKAVTLSEAIARSDRGPLPKIKEMMKNLKVEQATEDISHALDQMNNEIVRSSDDQTPQKPWWLDVRQKKSAAQRREKHLTTGAISFFSGIGLGIFLYFLTGALVLKLPPEFIAKVPFEIDPVVRILWLVGFMPVLSGLGHIVAGLMVRPDKDRTELTQGEKAVGEMPEREPIRRTMPASITERTTNLLGHEIK